MPPLDTFSTERLVAERLRPGHLPDCLRLLQDTRVTATVTPDGRPLSDDEVARWLQLSLEHWERNGFGDWALTEKSRRAGRPGRRFVGRAGLKRVEIDGRQEVELGYALLPAFWGRGLATEIAAAIVSAAFERIGLEQVVCYTLTANRASQRVMEKVGFRFEQEIAHAGLPHVLYRLRVSEFSARTR